MVAAAACAAAVAERVAVAEVAEVAAADKTKFLSDNDVEQIIIDYEKICNHDNLRADRSDSFGSGDV